MTMKPGSVAFLDAELAALDQQATDIFGEEAVLAAIQRVQEPVGPMFALERHRLPGTGQGGTSADGEA